MTLPHMYMLTQDLQLFGDEYILTHTHCMENVQYQTCISLATL